MRIFYCLILLNIVSCTSKDKSNTGIRKHIDTLQNGLEIVNTIDSPFYYKDQVDTDSLKSGYQLCYAKDDSSIYVFLKKDSRLEMLNKTNHYTSCYYLGIPVEDEEDYFILGHDQGNGAPYTCEFIDKKTMANPLGYGKEFLSYKIINKNIYLLFTDSSHRDKKMTLLNRETGSREFYELPENFWQLYMDTITSKILTIQFTLDRYGDSIQTSKYSR